jgi:hypothetical protein
MTELEAALAQLSSGKAELEMMDANSGAPGIERALVAPGALATAAAAHPPPPPLTRRPPRPQSSSR